MSVRSEGGLKLGCTVRVKVAPSDRVTAESELRLGLALFVEEAERVLGEAARVNVPRAIAYASLFPNQAPRKSTRPVPASGQIACETRWWSTESSTGAGRIQGHTAYGQGLGQRLAWGQRDLRSARR